MTQIAPRAFRQWNHGCVFKRQTLMNRSEDMTSAVPSLRRVRIAFGVMAVVAILTACTSSGPRTPATTSTSAPFVTEPVTPSTQQTVPDPIVVTSPPSDSVPVPTAVDRNGFDDHTVPRIESVAEFMGLAKSDRSGQSVVKFAFTKAGSDSGPVSLYDSNFFALHDEWYFFRLLNGQPVEGAIDQPWKGRTFETVDEIKAWAKGIAPDQLPVGLKFSKDRLYSNAFYNGAIFDEPRRFGVGSIVRVAAPPPAANDTWMIELEFVDRVSPAWVATVMLRVTKALPAEIADQLKWVVRSPQQDAVAKEMEQRKLAFSDRVIRYRDFIKAGTTNVYSEGIAAGRLRYVGEDDEYRDISSVQPGDIVITEHVPDWLPPANAFITSDPQTPLAHVNLLARNRGIPNLSRAGIHQDIALRRAADVRAYAMVIADGQSAKIAIITVEQYREWVERKRAAPIAVPPVDVASLPYVVDLTAIATEAPVTTEVLDRWRKIIGGKSAGFLSLLSTPGITPPVRPMAITVRPYIEHLAPMRPQIEQVLADPAFQQSAQARWLVLEGPKSFSKQFPSEADAAFAAGFMSAHPKDTALGNMVDAGGLRSMIEDQPVAAKTRDAIVAALSKNYSDHHPGTGLRFRSSSSVEDIEGFNGAGLYTSYTGYLNPDVVTDEAERSKTVERALGKAWGSYWSFEAFEERQLESIEHLSGAMGLTVHARFDDALETNNGVATFTYLPGGDAEVEINVQVGSTPVTNPDPTVQDLPEVIRVRKTGGTVTVERVSTSTLAGATAVLTDAAAEEVFRQTEAVASRWLDRLNATVRAQMKSDVTVLDFEFKTVAAGWPKLVDGKTPFQARLVLRQVRSLDPGLRKVPDSVRALSIRRDVLMRASTVTSARCLGNNGPVEFVEVLTDSLRRPDMGYSTEPYVVGSRPPIEQDCVRTSLYSSPDRYLLDLLARPDVFVISGP
jgi:hypothetical protein